MKPIHMAVFAALTAFLVGLAALKWQFAGPAAPGAVTNITAAASSSRLQIARFGHTSVVIGPFVYVMGGVDGEQPTDEVERAPILPDGRLGDFSSVAGLRLAQARSGHASVKIGDRLYVLGGFDGGGFLGTVEQAPIRSDGSLGAFAPVTGTGLVTPRAMPATAVLGHYLYVIGGHGRAGILGNAERAAIGPDGGLGTFAPVPGLALRTPRTCDTSVAIGKSLLVMGGVDRQGRLLTSVERATLEPHGGLGPFHTLKGVALRMGRSTPSSLVVGSFLYVLGGSDTTGKMFASIERARVRPDGTVGPFLPLAKQKLAIARSDQTNVLVDGAIYVLGGQDGAFRPLTSVEHLRMRARVLPRL
ncbi:MAG TPA: hypothetical protein V6D47_00320 [Oscillatoriaceae cyanobacterium]